MFSKFATRTPVRPPFKPTRTFCSVGGGGGGPASSNLRSRVCIARYFGAMAGELFVWL